MKYLFLVSIIAVAFAGRHPNLEELLRDLLHRDAAEATVATSSSYTFMGHGDCRGPEDNLITRMTQKGRDVYACKAMSSSQAKYTGYAYDTTNTRCFVYGSMTSPPRGWQFYKARGRTITMTSGDAGTSCYVKERSCSGKKDLDTCVKDGAHGACWDAVCYTDIYEEETSHSAPSAGNVCSSGQSWSSALQRCVSNAEDCGLCMSTCTAIRRYSARDCSDMCASDCYCLWKISVFNLAKIAGEDVRSWRLC